MQNRKANTVLVRATVGLIIEPWETAQINVYDPQQRATHA
jgi:hypothetical protein